MSRRTRALLFLPVGAVAFAGLLAAALGLPDFGTGSSSYGRFAAEHLLPLRGTTDVVAPITFDMRAFDTLGEEFILFAAAASCGLLLGTAAPRDDPEAEERREQDAPAIAFSGMRILAALLVAPTIVLGAYIVSHGHVTPGGGFQGGVIVAAVTLLAFAAGRPATSESHASLAEAVESAGAGAFALLGVGGLLFAGAAFESFLGRGTPGGLLSGGIVPLANVAVGVEVAGAFALIFLELLEQALMRPVE